MHRLIVPCQLRYIEECFFHWTLFFFVLAAKLAWSMEYGHIRKIRYKEIVCKIEVVCRHIKDCVWGILSSWAFFFFAYLLCVVFFFLNCPRTVFVTRSRWEQWKTRIREMSAAPLPSCCILKNEQQNNN